MALNTVRTTLHFVVVQLCLLWYCGMVSRTVGQSTFSDNFEGIQSPLNGRPYVVTCSSPWIYSTWSKWAACCSRNDPNCQFYTRCNAGTAFGFNDATWNWYTSQATCFSMTIYDHYSSASNSWMEIACAYEGWNVFTIYRNLDASATSTSSTPITSSSASTSEPSLTSVVATSTSSPPPPTTKDPEPSPSKAWIAGPVAGGIAALLLLGALFFWWRRRKNAQNSIETPPMTQTGAASGYQPEYVGNPHGNNYTPQLHSPSSPPAAPYYPPNSPPHYSSNSPGLHDASTASQYNYPASGTPNTMSWQGSPRPVSEQPSAGMQHKQILVEAP
ncbi:hypothetical protein B0H65DRAFT_436328 [Neurospora tetraspora]|uniref:Uncharacterized protein n=1 Tax=Neurospora tetraspora TaxID=94610 RepID=A0AAE0MJN2_9PEZI|nr:hypothetical protein B0H65DRAFT_436328 [Neurospora tetraspora]